MKILKIKKGDTVKIVKGKDVGKQGKVLRVIPGSEKIVVEGLNLFKKHLKGDGQKRESAIIDVAKPLSVANVRVVCPSCGEPTRVGFKVEGGKKVRICKKCGKQIDVERKASKPKSKTEATKAKKKVIKKTIKKTLKNK